MDKKRLTWITLGFGVVILMVVFLFAMRAERGQNHIQLPDENTRPSGDDGGYTGENSALPVVEITPDTVQQAIASMSRPNTYARTVSITTFWEGGASTEEIKTAVQGDILRTETVLSDASVRHLLTNGGICCIWYDDETAWRSFPAGSFTADTEQRIPTYEDILLLDKEEIAQAVYGEYEGVYCICVLTAADEDGYDTAYWISVESGLLVAAETRLHEETVYRMLALTLDNAPEESRFLLPDGTKLMPESDTN